MKINNSIKFNMTNIWNREELMIMFMVEVCGKNVVMTTTQEELDKTPGDILEDKLKYLYDNRLDR